MSALLSERIYQGTIRNPVRLLVVDDSVVMRALIGQMFGGRPEFQIVAAVATAEQAFACLQEQPADIILLDHEMPGMRGLDALPVLLGIARNVHVVMLSSHCPRGSQLAVDALSLGASDVILKPDLAHTPSAFADDLADRFLRMTASRHRIVAASGQYSLRPLSASFQLRCLGIGASTGGIRALAELLSGMTHIPNAPILLTQHLPEAFIPYFVQQVERMTMLPVHIAHEGMPMEEGHIYMAPGRHSLSCYPDSGGPALIRLISERDPVTQNRPSVNVMFEGMARRFGAGALGIVLTGIGRDGTMGASQIVKAGGVVIAQDAVSSTVWGMPGSVVRSGLATAVATPDSIMDHVRRYESIRGFIKKPVSC